ncbi:SMI1/KNR4 family protein [Streptomyces niveiscabiei]
MRHPLLADASDWIGPPLDPGMIRRAEAALGVRLPRSYVDLLSV